jgi:hypothetical protein
LNAKLCSDHTTFSFLYYTRDTTPLVSFRSLSFKFLSGEMYVTVMLGRAIPQAVSRWLPTAAARVRARVWSSGICGGQNNAGAGFLQVLRFPLPIFIPSIAPQSPSSIVWGCTIGQKWPQYLVT